ncbi:enoyl-CoA hydratase/isomerase family protein [Jatrophihabitans sp.]|uniref:enoyl-CoA hydratase/isomerase family protein n=1 Tax=Jatrophihabitans sp. TaxID=1932789 RepID=UPI0030C7179E|nr:Enoyl-CoA hydratase/isomerase [Jatrophihabitans sp.]
MPDQTYDFRSLRISVENQVATIRLRPISITFAENPPADPHIDLPSALEAMRTDNSIRVIVITGETDGEFLCAGSPDYYRSDRAADRLADPYGQWNVGLGVLRLAHVMTEIEKPIIAKVNGDAIGFGQSIVFGSDFIVAREDAFISDVHMGMAEVKRSGTGTPVGLPFGVVPGDGAGALIPLFMPPTQAKEYMMLSATHTAADLAEMHIVNRAVPLEELDAVVEHFSTALLKRSAFALAWTKRILNRHVAAQLNLTLDSSSAYEQLNLLQIQHLGFAGDPTSLQR